MPWVQVPSTLPTDKRTFALANALGIDRCAAIGIVTCLWAWALENSDDGRTPVMMQPVDMAEITCFRGDPVALDNALQKTFMDGTKIVDWNTVCLPYQNRIKANKSYNERRPDRKRNVDESSTSSQRNVNGILEENRIETTKTTTLRPPPEMLLTDFNELVKKYKLTSDQIYQAWERRGLNFNRKYTVSWTAKECQRIAEEQSLSLQSRRPLFTEEEAAAAIATAEREAEERRQPVDEETRAAIKRAREQIRVAVNGKA